MNLPVTSREHNDGTVRVAPHGEVDLDNAYRIREAVDSALVAGKPKKIVIDLNDVSLIDSVGIGVMVACYHAAAACDVPLEAADPSPLVYRQLWVSGLVGLFGLATPPVPQDDEASYAISRRGVDHRTSRIS